NPEALRRTAECGMLHSLSRTLYEEVRFDTEKVTSVDWITHPSLTHADTPAAIDIVLVNGDPNPNRADLPPYAGGETSCKPDLAGTITSGNRSAERIFGYSEAEAVGQPARLLIPPELQKDDQALLRRIRAGDPIEHFEAIRVRKDGRRIDVSVAVSPIAGADG